MNAPSPFFLAGFVAALLVAGVSAAPLPNQCMLTGATGGSITLNDELGSPTAIDPAALTDGNLLTGYSFSGLEGALDTGAGCCWISKHP